MATDLTQFKDYLHEHVSVAAPQIHALWVERLMVEADMDDLRKYMEFAAKVTGANVDPKTDANAGLAVFHFHMDGSGMKTTIDAPLQLVEEVQAVQEAIVQQNPELAQTAHEISKVSEPAADEPMDILADLDALLGGLDDDK